MDSLCQVNILDIINAFEKNNDYCIPSNLKNAAQFNNLIHLNQLNDIKNEDFDHICFIGNYTNLFKDTYELLKIPNTVFRNFKNQVFLTKDLKSDEFRPVHTAYSFPSKLVNSFDEVFSGMIKFEQYYILLNTENNEVIYNVYTLNKNHCTVTNADYLFFVFIGKIINPAPYTMEEVNAFESKHNLSLSERIKKYLTESFKVLTLKMDGAQKIFYINLLGDNEYLSKPFNKEIKESYDLEHYRKPLLKIWQSTILDEEIDKINLENNLNTIRNNIKAENNVFLNGFMKIGTIENENYKSLTFTMIKDNKEVFNTNLVVEIYMLLNTSPENQGTLWIYHLNEPGTANITDIHYLPTTRIFKIGSI